MNITQRLIADIKKDVNFSGRKADPTYLKLVEVFPLQSITSKRQYENALTVIEKLIGYASDKKSKDKGIELYLKILSDFVGDYERNEFASENVTGAEMLAYLMDLQNLKQTDISDNLGGQSAVSKILKGERELNLRQIKSLAKRFKVSPGVFI